MQNKYYPEGHGTADNFWSLAELGLILDALLAADFQVACTAAPFAFSSTRPPNTLTPTPGTLASPRWCTATLRCPTSYGLLPPWAALPAFALHTCTQVVYNHPELSLLGAADKNDEGKAHRGFQLGDAAFIRRGYAGALASGALLLLPELARGAWAALPYNEVQLRVLAKSACFLAPQGGASYLTFYQPGLHVVNDRTGKERCVSAQLASKGTSGTYWHYFTRLPGSAGPSVIYNVNGNRSRLRAVLDVMASSDVCAVGGDARAL